MSQPWPPGDGGAAGGSPAAAPPIIWHQIPPRQPALPTVPRQYHEFYRTPRMRWWRPLAALAMLMVAWLAVSLFVMAIFLSGDLVTGRLTLEELAEGRVTPNLFLANNLALALAVPVSYLAHWAASGQRPRWLSSIAGAFRWGLLLRFMLLAAPLYLLSLAIEGGLSGQFETLRVNQDSWFLVATIVLTTPFQAAGEEMALRGLMARAVGSWFPSRRVGLVVACGVTSLAFMTLHGSNDPWLNLFYFSVGVATSVLVWRTGGLEAPIALHVVNNLVGEVTLPFSDLDGLFDRSAGTGSAWVLVQLTVVAAVTAGILWQARRLNLPTSAAPAASPRPTMEVIPAAGGPRGPGNPTTDKGVR